MKILALVPANSATGLSDVTAKHGGTVFPVRPLSWEGDSLKSCDGVIIDVPGVIDDKGNVSEAPGHKHLIHLEKCSCTFTISIDSLDAEEVLKEKGLMAIGASLPSPDVAPPKKPKAQKKPKTISGVDTDG